MYGPIHTPGRVCKCEHITTLSAALLSVMHCKSIHMFPLGRVNWVSCVHCQVCLCTLCRVWIVPKAAIATSLLCLFLFFLLAEQYHLRWPSTESFSWVDILSPWKGKTNGYRPLLLPCMHTEYPGSFSRWKSETVSVQENKGVYIAVTKLWESICTFSLSWLFILCLGSSRRPFLMESSFQMTKKCQTLLIVCGTRSSQ